MSFPIQSSWQERRSWQDVVASPQASLSCRTIRIGTYEYTPKEKVIISSEGIKIVAPSLKDETRDVALEIPWEDITRVEFSKHVPAIFLSTFLKCADHIKNVLDMTRESGYYYNPWYNSWHNFEPYRRISLLPESISDETKMVFKALFAFNIKELIPQEANAILSLQERKYCKYEGDSVTEMISRAASPSSTSGAKRLEKTIDDLQKQLLDAQCTIEGYRYRAKVASDMKVKERATVEKKLRKAEQDTRSVQKRLDQETRRSNKLVAGMIRMKEKVQAQAREIEEAKALKQKIADKDLMIEHQAKTILEHEKRIQQLKTDVDNIQRTLNKSIGSTSPNNSIGAASPNNSIGAASPNNSIGAASPNNSIGAASPNNSIGAASPNNSIGSASSNNSIGSFFWH